MFGRNISCDELRRDNEYLRDERDRLERERSEAQEREHEREEQRRRERWAERETQIHYAADWSEAFSNGLILYRREANHEIQFNNERPDEPPDTWFQDQIPPIQLAQQLYREKMQPVRERIERLTKMLEKRALNDIAAEVERQHPGATVIESLRQNRPHDLVEW